MLGNESKPQGLLVHQLLNIYGNNRLILSIGDGSRLIHPLKPELTEAGSIFLNWKDRAILSTRPLPQWAAEEYILADNFVLLQPMILGGQKLSIVSKLKKKIDSWEPKYGSDQVRDEILFTG